MSEKATEIVFNDTFADLLQNVDSALGSQEILLAHCLRKFLPACQVYVVWRSESSERDFDIDDERGARGQVRLGDKVVELQAEEIQEVLKSVEPLSLPQHPRQLGSAPYLDIRHSVESSQRRAIELSSTSDTTGGVAGRLLIALDPPTDRAMRYRVEWLMRNIAALGKLFAAFVGLKNMERRFRVMLEVTQLPSHVGNPTRERLRQACRLVQGIDRYQTSQGNDQAVSLAVELAETVMQEVLGTGWDVQNTEGNAGIRHARELIEHLNNTAEGINQKRTLHADTTPELLDRLNKLILMIQHSVDQPIPNTVGEPLPNVVNEATLEAGVVRRLTKKRTKNEDPKETKALIDDQMVLWCEIYRLAKQEVSTPGRQRSVEDETWWSTKTLNSLKELGGILKWTTQEYINTMYLPAWLRLWFCHLLLWHSLKDPRFRGRSIIFSQKWIFRRDLAYVIRESLRIFNYGDRPDYMFQPAAYAAALRTLVEHHALWIINLPRDHDIRGLLSEIGKTQEVKGFEFAVGHLQHALEVYIAGHFLCSTNVTLSYKGKKEKWSMAQVLASGSGWKAGDFTVGEFYRAFSLAALFHDIGMLLMPRWSPQKLEVLLESDRLLQTSLGDVDRGINETMTELSRQCERELREAEYYDPTEEPELARWISHRIEAGEGDPCLLGAWYIHRLCQNVEGLQSDTVRQVVRAVLLHGVVTQRIDTDLDPAAALLVLCNELFERIPNTRGKLAPNSVGRAFHSLAVDVRPQTSRFRNFKIHGLKITVAEGDDKGKIIGKIRLKDSAKDLWPQLELMLHDQEYLEVPVYHLWLSLTQRLQRIGPSKRRWGPNIVLRSYVPGRLADLNFTTRLLLQEVADHCRPTLRPTLSRWLAGDESAPSAFGVEDSIEELRIRPLGQRFHREDIERSLGDVEDAVEKILLDRERQIRSQGE